MVNIINVLRTAWALLGAVYVLKQISSQAFPDDEQLFSVVFIPFLAVSNILLVL